MTENVKAASYGHAVNPAISASFNPQIFGFFSFRNIGDRRLQQVRHVMRPTIGFSYVPYLKGFSSKMYRQVQVDTIPTYSEYSIFENGIYGTPALSSKSGNLSFGISNILGAKIFERNDTTGKPKTVSIIDNFGISTSYNIFADAFNWAPVTMSARTTLANNINISASSSFSLYAINEKGESMDVFSYQGKRETP